MYVCMPVVIIILLLCNAGELSIGLPNLNRRAKRQDVEGSYYTIMDMQ